MDLFSARWCICRHERTVLLFGRGRPNKGDQGPKILPEMANISASGVVYCGETSKLLWRRLSAAAYGCEATTTSSRTVKKMCAPCTKMPPASAGLRPLTPTRCAPWTLAALGLCLHTPVIDWRSCARHSSPPFCCPQLQLATPSFEKISTFVINVC